MWGLVLIAAAAASWGVTYSLTSAMMSRLDASRSELMAGRLVAEHDCGIRGGVCPGGYQRDSRFARYVPGVGYGWTYTVHAYQARDAYLPIVVEKALNTSLCVATVRATEGGRMVINAAGVSSFCPGKVPAEIDPDVLPVGSVVLYQRRV